jgi:hypothetical protein
VTISPTNIRCLLASAVLPRTKHEVADGSSTVKEKS